jgi:hypothetical protein
VKEFLKDKDMEVLDWPDDSPYLNPMETVWNFMKNKLKMKSITSFPVLKDVIKKLWFLNTSQEYPKKLSDSMPRRQQLVIEHKGEMPVAAGPPCGAVSSLRLCIGGGPPPRSGVVISPHLSSGVCLVFTVLRCCCYTGQMIYQLEGSLLHFTPEVSVTQTFFRYHLRTI